MSDLPLRPQPDSDRHSRLLRRLGGSLLAVELRPPRNDLSHTASIDSWIDMHHAVRRLAKKDAIVFLTDNAVGVKEEENLHHLASNLGDQVNPDQLVPFLTCKHTLDYCLMYAARAASLNYPGLVVLGGDKDVGAPRCLAHAYQLRQQIRERYPDLLLGGWANPHREAGQQVAYLQAEEFTADFFLTQVVSHHDLPAVERFVAEFQRERVQLPGVFGVFYYRSASQRTLKRLAKFLPVPGEQLREEFAQGLSPEEICARTIQSLRSLGIKNVYVSNLGQRQAARRLRRIREILDS